MEKAEKKERMTPEQERDQMAVKMVTQAMIREKRRNIRDKKRENTAMERKVRNNLAEIRSIEAEIELFRKAHKKQHFVSVTIKKQGVKIGSGKGTSLDETVKKALKAAYAHSQNEKILPQQISIAMIIDGEKYMLSPRNVERALEGADYVL